MKKILSLTVTLLLATSLFSQNKIFKLNDQEYFENTGVNVLAFQDIYPEGHQGELLL